MLTVGEMEYYFLGNNPALGAENPWMGDLQSRSPQLSYFGVAHASQEMKALGILSYARPKEPCLMRRFGQMKGSLQLWALTRNLLSTTGI